MSELSLTIRETSENYKISFSGFCGRLKNIDSCRYWIFEWICKIGIVSLCNQGYSELTRLTRHRVRAPLPRLLSYCRILSAAQKEIYEWKKMWMMTTVGSFNLTSRNVLQYSHFNNLYIRYLIDLKKEKKLFNLT